MGLRTTAPQPTPMLVPRASPVPTARPRYYAGASAPALALEPAVSELGSTEQPLAVSVIAHELRAPLSSLAAASELLLDDLNTLDPRQMRDMLQVIRDGTLWLQGLVENLLCAASIQAGRFRIQAERLNLLDVVMDVQPIVTPLLLQKGQSLKLAGVQSPKVEADRRWVGQALVNLVANASKYSPDNTPITIRLSERAGYVRAAVADRGPGLPEGGASRLFEPFVRGAGADAADQGGVGLGLAIVRTVIEAHGGRLGAENRRKGGANVWLELPSSPAC